jgi:hypothetical protein
MDQSIRAVTPQIMQDRGADAFDRGLGIDDHDMNPGSRAIVDWQISYMQRQRELQDDRAWAARELDHALAEACPP